MLCTAGPAIRRHRAGSRKGGSAEDLDRCRRGATRGQGAGVPRRPAARDRDRSRGQPALAGAAGQSLRQRDPGGWRRRRRRPLHRRSGRARGPRGHPGYPARGGPGAEGDHGPGSPGGGAYQ